MIHAIYIYFIINALITGVSIGKKDRISFLIFSSVFGLPFYACAFSYYFIGCLLKLIDDKLLIQGFYRLYFTDKFSAIDKQTVDLRRRQYFGQAGIGVKNRELNKYEKFFLRQIDKKYNYGICNS